jgi:NADH-quinone oxidoreductase subunit N
MWIPSGGQLWMCAPELALVGTIVAVLLVPLIVRRNSYATAVLSLAGALGASALAVYLAPRVAGRGLAGLAPDHAAPMLLADNLSVFFKCFLMLFLVAIIVLWLIGSARSERSAPEFFVLLLSSALGMALMVSTLNLLMLVIAIELASLPSYAIVGFNKQSPRGAEASLKYVLFGAVCAAVMLYGVSLLYGYYGTLDLGLIARYVAEGVPAASGGQLIAPGLNPILALGALGLLVGVGFKISAVPFHFWCPDVFEGAPIEVTTWLSVSSKAAGLCLLLRLMGTFAATAHATLDAIGAAALLSPLAWTVGIMAAVTCTLANLAAYRQTNVKRLLAYSSIAHAGYMLMLGAALSIAPGGGNETVSALVAYILVYMFMNLGAFGTCALVGWHSGSEDLSAFTGLGRRAPLLAVPMAICLFSLVGLPPLGGFIAKWWLLVALGHSAGLQPWLWGLIVVAALNTLLSLFYYLKVIVQMYLKDDGKPAWHAPIGGLAVVNVCAVVLLLLGTVLANPLKHRSDRYATNLFGPAVVADTGLHSPSAVLASAEVPQND